MTIVDVLPHAVDLINGNQGNVRKSHEAESQPKSNPARIATQRHVCPHKTGSGAADDRNSTYPMLAVDTALNTILVETSGFKFSHENYRSPINIPEFRASIKDGYAVKADGACKGIKNVVGFISAGEDIIHRDFNSNECFKINTGAPVPDFATAVIQVEDTILKESEKGVEKKVEFLIEATEGLDIR